MRNYLAITVISSLLFGFAHIYQGVRGIVLTAILGAWLLFVAATAGLLVAIVLHALIDIRLLVVPADIADAATLHE